MQGLLLIDKPEGITSFGVVAKIKRISGVKRVGHTGTLDPMATGVLPILIGRATVLCDFLLTAYKEYIATVRLGITTDTLDKTGKVIKISEVNILESELLTVLDSFKGKQMQNPPMFSAIKKDGVRLYDLARKGQEVERTPREIEIKEIELLQFNKDTFKIRVLCSKGTYIRSLAEDIGKKLSVGAILTDLRRTKTAGFNTQNCIPLEDISEDNIRDLLYSEEMVVAHYPETFVSEKQGVRFSNGGELALERIKNIASPMNGEIYRVKCGNTFLGLGIIDLEKNALKIKCLVNNMPQN